MDNKAYILADDLGLIKEQLQMLSGYDFADDLAMRMKKIGLSQSALAARIQVSHVTVGKWLNKNAKPHGKERFKELGMALGMNESQLNTFLCANCYPRLYAKNPLDLVCKFILGVGTGGEDTVSRYKNMLEQYGLNDYTLSSEPVSISTTVLSMDFAGVKSLASFEEWLTKNDDRFRAYDKAYIPNSELIRFILLYIGEQSINDMFIAGELPITIRNLLYPLISNKEIAVKGLRAKLIAFGFYENMAEDELDILLEIAKLQPFSEPMTLIDNVLLTALRCAHERYPYFELNNVERIMKSLSASNNQELCSFYQEKGRKASDCVKYYEADGHKGELERLFEESYTDYADKGVLHYINDVLMLLISEAALSEAEVGEYLPIQVYRDEL